MAKSRYHIHKNINGFSLIELIVVLAGLGILSSLAIPNVIKYLDYARVDEAKSLLNSAAADCLQELRRKGEGRLNDAINSDIISFVRLKNTGYVFKDGANRSTDEDYLPNCSTVLITAASEDDRTERLPDLGFTLSIDGTLTKIAVNSGSETKFPAESWAGKNTTEETELIEWQELNSAIIKEKTSCKEKRKSFAKSPGIGRTKMWDPVKTSKCTTKPPKFEDEQTCTANGCTKDVYYLDGAICGYTQEEFNQCRREKTTAACQAEKDKKASEKATTQTVAGDQLPNCDEPVWFFKGEDVGSSESWQDLMCTKNIKDKQDRLWTDEQAPSPIEHCFLDDGSPRQFYFCNGTDVKDSDVHGQCIRTKQSAECDEDIQKKRESGHNGEYTNSTQGPPPCGKKVWFCNKTQQDTEDEYLSTECGQTPKCKPRNKKLCGIYKTDFWCCVE